MFLVWVTSEAPVTTVAMPVYWGRERLTKQGHEVNDLTTMYHKHIDCRTGISTICSSEGIGALVQEQVGSLSQRRPNSWSTRVTIWVTQGAGRGVWEQYRLSGLTPYYRRALRGYRRTHWLSSTSKFSQVNKILGTSNTRSKWCTFQSRIRNVFRLSKRHK